MPRAVIVGAGPAGIAAATVLVGSAVQVTLVDEAPGPGGQIHRAPAPGLALDMRAVLGGGYGAFLAFHQAARTVLEQVDYRPSTLAWTAQGGAVHVAGAGLEALPYDALILATGATDRIMPVPGWLLPGVFTLGAAQAVLKGQGCLVGRRTVFCGSSPLLYVAALQYRRMGGTVAAVLDTTPFTRKLRASTDLLQAPATLAKGIEAMARLHRDGVRIRHGVRLVAFEGDDRLHGIAYRTDSGRIYRVACDAAAFGHGLRPESQLAEVAGCALRFDPVQRLHVPATDADGRAGHGIYVAGDGGTIGGAEAAEVSGALAGSAVLHDLGLPAPDGARARRTLHRLRRFQRGLAMAFAWPGPARVTELPDDVAVCRCEGVTAGAVRAALRQGATEPNRIKAATRCGMGRCQGRFCGPALAELAAAESGAEPGRLRAQPPVKPLPASLAADAPL